MMYNTEHKRALRDLNNITQIKERIATKKAITSHPNAIHLILSNQMSKRNPVTSVEMFQKQLDINDVWSEDFDINNSILADEPMELKQEQEHYESRFIEEYETVIENILELEQDG